MGNKTAKCVVVGDSGVGKTSLVQCYKMNGLSGDVPATAEPLKVTVPMPAIPGIGKEGKELNVGLELLDTATRGGAAIDKAVFKGAQVVVICFAVDDAESLENIRGKWAAEVKANASSAKVIIVGCKTDKERAVEEEAANALAKEVGALKCINCTATSAEGVKNVVTEAVKAAISGGSKPKCVIQ